MPITSVPANDRRERFVASAGQTVFPFDFPIYASGDLTARRLRAGVELQLSLGSDYTLAGAGEQAGGTITLTVPALVNDVILLTGAQASGRQAQFVNGGDLPAAALEAEFNRIAIFNQQLQDQSTRAIRLAETDTNPTNLPAAAVRASKVLGFDSVGNMTAVAQGNQSALTVTAAGGTLARSLAERAADTLYVRDFGALGNGSADDTAALQLALNALGQEGGRLVFHPGRYRVSSQLLLKATADQVDGPDINIGANLQFQDSALFELAALGDVSIEATASMASILKIGYPGAPLNEISPQYFKLDTLKFIGGTFATRLVETDFAWHGEVIGCRFDTAGDALYLYGRGAMVVRRCVFRARRGIVGARFGDSRFELNDFYVRGTAAQVRQCIYMGAWGGNTVIRANTFTFIGADNASNNVNTACIVIDGAASDVIGMSTAKGNRHILIEGNENNAMALFVQGTSDTSNDLSQIKVIGNHCFTGESTVTQFAYFQRAVDVVMAFNHCNDLPLQVSTNSPHVQFDICQDVTLFGNHFGGCLSSAVLITGGCFYVQVRGNHFRDTVRSNIPVIYIEASSAIIVEGNLASQSTAWTTVFGTHVISGSNVRFGTNLLPASMTAPYTSILSAATITMREEFAPAAPAVGTWRVGDRTWNTAPVAGGTAGWICTTAGTPGTWKTFGAIAP